jgi:hypothetical protein
MHGRRRKKSAFPMLQRMPGQQDDQQEKASQDWEKAKTNNSETAKDKVAAESKDSIQKVEIVNNNDQARPRRGRAIRGAFASMFGR